MNKEIEDEKSNYENAIIHVIEDIQREYESNLINPILFEQLYKNLNVSLKIFTIIGN